MLHGIFRGAHTACGFEQHLLAGFLVPLLDHLAHDVRRFRRSSRGDFACGRLDVSGAGSHTQDAGLGDVLRGPQCAHFQNDLEVGVACSGFHLLNLVEAGLVVAREELALRQDDVDVGSAGSHCQCHFSHFDLDERLCCGESACYGRNAHAFSGQELLDGRHQSGVGTDGCHVLQAGELIRKIVDFCGHLGQLLLGVVTVQTGQLYHTQQAFPHLAVVVLRIVRRDDFLYFCFHLLVREFHVVLSKQFFKFVHGKI